MLLADKRIIDKIWVKASVLLVLFVVAYWIPLRGILSTWRSEEDDNYGFLIPFVWA